MQDNWQPIETAPLDGTAFLAYPYIPQWRMPEIVIGFFSEAYDSFFAESSVGCRFEPTHWMPLPNPPTSEKQ